MNKEIIYYTIDDKKQQILKFNKKKPFIVYIFKFFCDGKFSKYRNRYQNTRSHYGGGKLGAAK